MMKQGKHSREVVDHVNFELIFLINSVIVIPSLFFWQGLIFFQFNIFLERSMSCKCQIIEKENNSWIIAVSECVEGHECFGPFSSKYEVDAFFNEYLSKHVSAKECYDFEHPEKSNLIKKIKSPPFKYKLWDFEDYKVMAWRNAGFRSRK